MTTTEQSRLGIINHMSIADLQDNLHRCCACTNWIEKMVEHRPFTSIQHLHQIAVQNWTALSTEDFLEAFKGHPMIGADINELRKKFTTTSSWSEGEQSGVEGASEAVLKRLQRANIEYLERFGYIFIVCATGKTAGEMLELLENRLYNEPSVEIHIAAAEQQKITAIRLDKWLEQLSN